MSNTDSRTVAIAKLYESHRRFENIMDAAAACIRRDCGGEVLEFGTAFLDDVIQQMRKHVQEAADATLTEAKGPVC